MTNGTQALPLGHKLLWYTIQEVLGQGGFGMTYLATDTNLNRQVAIKEYLPTMFASRNEDFTVNPLSADHEDDYNWGLTSFLTEARTLAQFKHRNVVQVQTVFEAYETAYMVMEYEQGESLDHIFKSRLHTLDQSFFEGLLFPVMDGLQAIHDAGFIHRDIKPGNLYIRSDGSPVLIDFGSARETSQQETSEMTTLVSQGYTPIEQYGSSFGEQGPWTDIYSLAASVYQGITGSRPDDALNRSGALMSAKPDPLRELTGMRPNRYSESFCQAIDSALLLKPEERPQSLAAWRTIFENDAGIDNRPIDNMAAEINDDATRLLPPNHAASPRTTRQPDDFETFTSPPTQRDDRPYEASIPTQKPQKKSNAPLAAGVAVLLLALAGGGWWVFQHQQAPSVEVVVTADLLNELPKPPQSVSWINPTTEIEAEIAEFRVLTAVYQDLLEADPNSAQGREGMSYVIQNYEQIANLGIVKTNNSIRNKLNGALRAITNRTDPNNEAERLIEKLASSGISATFSDLKPLLDKNSLTLNEQEDLFYGLTSLPDSERAIASRNKRVTELTSQFKKSIVDAVRAKQFQRAGNMTALALLVNPDDSELDLLKRHLENAGN